MFYKLTLSVKNWHYIYEKDGKVANPGTKREKKSMFGNDAAKNPNAKRISEFILNLRSWCVLSTQLPIRLFLLVFLNSQSREEEAEEVYYEFFAFHKAPCIAAYFFAAFLFPSYKF